LLVLLLLLLVLLQSLVGRCTNDGRRLVATLSPIPLLLGIVAFAVLGIGIVFLLVSILVESLKKWPHILSIYRIWESLHVLVLVDLLLLLLWRLPASDGKASW